ncbi:YciI family protein [Streptomyces sp. MZ04]|uniref:YciI family protein n=1 Tax=Streptomyces sp. MZ04 TaxID=2559236 RepID=UPI00107EDC21|nr:YciI family protein [Streptomyces sp. MZ04]TGA95331.1 YciI family protein [Streptomyces sp. MZ04]
MNQTLWVAHCLDAPDIAELRKKLRDEHSRYLRDGVPVPVLYGPLTDGQGRATGSLIVMACPDRATVEEHFAKDPFTTGGIWAQVRIDAFTSSERSPVRLPVPPAAS